MGKIIRNGINYSSTTDAAKNINYDNSASGLAATTAQKAIDELNRKIAAGGGGSSSNIVYLTQAEYDALPEDKLEDNIEYWITDAGVRGSAENVSYDASASGLDAKNVQEAVDKLAEGAGNKVEYLTQEEYDALPEDKLTNNVEYRILDSGTPTTAHNVGYDGSASGIDAINVQGAIDDLKEDVVMLTESLKVSDITSINNQKNTKSCPHAAYVDFFSYTPTEDTFVYVEANCYLSGLENSNGTCMMQLHSTDNSKSYVNTMMYANPYTKNIGTIALNLDRTFLAKAGVTYKIRFNQATEGGVTHQMLINVNTNVQWTVL